MRAQSPAPAPSLERTASPLPDQLSNDGPKDPSDVNVAVILRFRPLNSSEKERGDHVSIEFKSDRQSLKVLPPPNGFIANTNNYNLGKTDFTFDRVYSMSDRQSEIYEEVAKPIIAEVLKGYNGTIFTYGQTGSGKTYTMTGLVGDPEYAGIMPRVTEGLFEAIEAAGPSFEFAIKVSFVEIYMERIRDLFDSTGQNDNLPIREDKNRNLWVIEGATSHYVASSQELMDLIEAGSVNRVMGRTNMNEQSSRSHCIFMITVSQQNLVDGRSKTGKMYLVDLAGSEKVQKTGSDGMRLEEAKLINKSLTTLGMVINALTDGRSTHVPYRDSKLTRVLEESLGGNARTALVLAASPSSWNLAETLSTLRFGNRAKNIRNKPRVNQELSVDELKQLLAKSQNEISSLKRRMRHLENETLVLRGMDPAQVVKATRAQVTSAIAATGRNSAIPFRAIDDDVLLAEPEPQQTCEEQLQEFLGLSLTAVKHKGLDVQTHMANMCEQLMGTFVEKEDRFKRQSNAVTDLKERLQSAEEQVGALTEDNDSLMYKLALATGNTTKGSTSSEAGGDTASTCSSSGVDATIAPALAEPQAAFSPARTVSLSMRGRPESSHVVKRIRPRASISMEPIPSDSVSKPVSSA